MTSWTAPARLEAPASHAAFSTSGSGKRGLQQQDRDDQPAIDRQRREARGGDSGGGD